jgi:hypothetical protein
MASYDRISQVFRLLSMIAMAVSVIGSAQRERPPTFY